jgi:ArsR family transcriptional regulator, arsenate/arsenite/antimonite-responsive transcriptional repressor
MKKLPVVCCAPGAPPLAEKARAALADRFKALSDPSRVAIVNRLAGADEVCVCVFVDSHHLRVLREAGLVESSRRGTWAYYRLIPSAVAELARALGGEPAAASQAA